MRMPSGRNTPAGQQGLEQLLCAEGPKLLQYISHRLPSRVAELYDANDVLQDVYVEAFRRPPEVGFDSTDAGLNWLKTIAYRNMIDLVRAVRAKKRGGGRLHVRTGGHGESSVEAVLEELAVYRRTPSQSAASHEFMQAVDAALARLSEDHRRVIALRHFDGYSVRETAARLGRSERATIVLCSRALAALQSQLQSASPYV
jgi:RNA polymerase sigma-70 factor (ECF subfamily)